LISEYAKGRHTIIIVDEAQNLDIKALEELRMLSNINSDGVQLLQVILVGQPQLRAMLKRPELTQFAQRISADYHLGPLDADEGVRYIDYRLALAGAQPHLFSRGAAEMIAKASGGVPRVINMICDTALVYGLAHHARKINTHIVEAVLRDRKKFGLLPLQPIELPRSIRQPVSLHKKRLAAHAVRSRVN
jgi:general secretion pathway protein A